MENIKTKAKRGRRDIQEKLHKIETKVTIIDFMSWIKIQE